MCLPYYSCKTLPHPPLPSFALPTSHSKQKIRLHPSLSFSRPSFLLSTTVGAKHGVLEYSSGQPFISVLPRSPVILPLDIPFPFTYTLGTTDPMLFLFLSDRDISLHPPPVAVLMVRLWNHEDVRRDMDMALDNVVPESLNWKHTDEGPE